MAAALVSAAISVLRTALAPVADPFLEAWAASKGLGTNVEDLKKELLLVKVLLEHIAGKEIHNSALEELLQKLQDLAYDADDVLDELDYFRVQDELDGTSKAVDEHPKGCAHNLALNARHTAKAVGKMLWLAACSSAATSTGAGQRARDAISTAPRPKQPDGETNGRMHRLAFGSCNPIRAVGKCLPCSSLPTVSDDNNNAGHSGVRNTQQREHASGTPKLNFDRVDISKRMKLLIEQMGLMRRDVSEIIRTLGSNWTTAPDIAKSRPITTSESIEPKLYGRDDVINTIVHDITKGKYANKDLTVLPILGPGGIGKTTLTQHIYHNQEVQKHFEVKVWTCVKSEEKGNIIIMTTRVPALAQMVKTIDEPVELEGIKGKEFEKLFLAYIFDDERSRKDHTYLLETGEKIMRKLKGSPLAAKTVGKLLRNNLDLDHWTRVLESREWESQKGSNDIMPALKLSYDYLPFHLQHCFVYCALFPQDYKFDSKELIHFWMGLDILHPGGHTRNPEEIGVQYLHDLMSLGFLKEDKKFEQPCYLLHDLLHDLALKVASRECSAINWSNVRSTEIQPSIRHLSIIIDDTDDSEGISNGSFATELRNLKMKFKVQNLRTLLIFGKSGKRIDSIFYDCIRDATALRVLHCSRTTFSIESMPLVHHLRYLRLSGISVVHLQRLVCRLYHLRILDVTDNIGGIGLPLDMSNLTKLCHFLTRYDGDHSCMSNVGKLQFLQELKCFKVKKESRGFELKQLAHLTNLTDLGIYNCEKILTEEEAAEANLTHKTNLRKLTLGWDNNELDVEALVIEKLQSHRNLHDLCIRGHGNPSCPTWLSNKLSVQALKSLCLDSVAWEVLPQLGQMWMLQELKLKNISTIKEFDTGHFGSITEQSFRRLKSLELIRLGELVTWVLGDTHHLFSQLEVLNIEECPKLLGLPFEDSQCYPPKQDPGGKIHWFPSLREFNISKCKNVKSLPPIPWTHTLCSVNIFSTGSMLLSSLVYSKTSRDVRLGIEGKDSPYSLDDVLVFNNLTDLEDLEMSFCPPIESKHLRMLTSLNRFEVSHSSHAFVPSESEAEVKWQLPVKKLQIINCQASGKNLTQLLNHLSKVLDLTICGSVNKIHMLTQIGVEGDMQKLAATASSSSSSAAEIEDSSVTYVQRQIGEEAEEHENVEDGLLLLPAHYSDVLQKLCISYCPELCLVAPLPNDGYKAGRGGAAGGGLRALRCLQKLLVSACPKFLSAYKISSCPSCFPFPSPLQHLLLSSKWTDPACYLYPEQTDLAIQPILGCMEQLSNLTSLTQLELYWCGEDLRLEGLWPIITQGHLSILVVFGSPKFFVGSDAMRGWQGGDPEQLPLPRSPKLGDPKLENLRTDNITAVLAQPICAILSSSLTKLRFSCDIEMVRFTEEQEEALLLLTSLQNLSFHCCYKLQCLPAGLCKLPKLKELAISFCEAIISLPKDGLPNSLQQLYIGDGNDEELYKHCRNFIDGHPGIKLFQD
ncbi:hypothetical protein ACP4OV_025652 [Aristida adscensionis]